MKSRLLTCCLSMAGLLWAGAGPADAQDTGGGAPGEQEMMELMAKYAQPGPFHQRFEKLAGSWTVTVKMWMAPGAPPMESAGQAEFEPILGGRYLVQRFKGEMMDTTFEGMGLTAYDNFAERFIDVWIDEMSTTVMVSYGQPDSTGDVITYHSKMDDPMTGRQDVPMRSVATFVDDNTHMIEMYTTDPTGQEFQTMEIVYKRQE